MAILVLAASTRAALIYRSDVEAINTRILAVESINTERNEVRMAALIEYQKQQKTMVPKPKPKPKPKSKSKSKMLAQAHSPKVSPEVELREPVAVVKPAKENSPVVVISVSQAEMPAPKNVEQALLRLQQGRDDAALRWAVNNSKELGLSSSWEHFRQHIVVGRSAEQYYQLGVLYGALQQHEKSQQWLGSAVELDEQARYLRAYAISVDRQGLQKKAIAAYWRYLNSPQSRGSGEIRARISRLEQP